MVEKKVCEICLRFSTGDAFVEKKGKQFFPSGFLKMRRDSLKRHLKSQNHKKAISNG